MTALVGRPDVEQEIRLDEWLYAKGLPGNITAPTTSTL